MLAVRTELSIEKKSARIIVKNKDLLPINRFCIRTAFTAVLMMLYIYGMFYRTERRILGLKSTTIVKLWIEWLESSSAKEWESFLAWALGTLWYIAMYLS
ncbi:hypothetical protein AVEN_176121-1 [Araneus ventricosus]|uniref:Uncharacterized protein n=1 Tax=Araneus ventricosus TaxID=182803 RepID=A0A4Y2T7V6_ARAVE|nr:hypothetical protein AVEN_176121-1 [Araneus ventricosus]